MKWFVLPFPLLGAAAGLVIALDVRDNAAGVNDALREHGTPTMSLPWYRVFAGVSTAVALGLAVAIFRMDF